MADEVVQHYLYSTSANDDSYIKNEDTTNPIYVTPYQGSETVEHAVTAGDYVVNWWYNNDDPIVPSAVTTPLYVYTTNSKWEYVGQATGWGWGWYGCNEYYDACGADIHLKDVPKNEVEGSTVDEILIQGEEEGYYNIEDIDGTGGYKRYGTGYSSPDYTEPITVKAGYGDFLEVRYDHNWYDYVYQYPGVWVAADQYPDLTINPEPPQVKSHVQLKWTDPQDLTDWDPYPCTWEGTVIVRKEDSPPLHRWDGEKIVRTTTRDKYKTEPYKDEDIVSGKTYYYAFMPYYTRYEDPDHPIRFYTFTKVIKVEIGDKSLSSTIDSIDVDGIDATINYTLSQPDGGSFTSIKMYGKIGKNPKCDNTDDVIEDVDSSVTSLTLTGLESGSTYYFCLVTMDTNNKKLSSNVMSCYPFDPVPANIKPYIEKINTTTWGASDTYTLLQYSNRRGNSNTWVLDDIYAYTTRDNFNNDSNCYDLIVLSECDIVVTSNNNSVIVNYNYTVAPHDVIQTSGRDMWGTYSQSGNHGDYIQTWGDRSGINFYGQYNVDTITFSLTTSFNSLTDCMSYLTQHFRRINSLKVDGYDWIKK